MVPDLQLRTKKVFFICDDVLMYKKQSVLNPLLINYMNTANLYHVGKSESSLIVVVYEIMVCGVWMWRIELAKTRDFYGSSPRIHSRNE